MRRLGSALGVEAMALYNHFDDREAILDAVADSVFESVPVPDQRGPWRARLVAIAVVMRSVALAHPRVFKAAMSRPTKPSRALPLMEAALGALREGGLNTQDRVQAYFALTSYLRGWILWEIEQACMVKPPYITPESLKAHPEIAAVAAALQQSDLERVFVAGVQMVLSGATLPVAQAKPHPRAKTR